MDILFFAGRVVFGGYFLMQAYNHLAKSGHMVGYAASKGVPSPRFAIIASGLFLLAGGLSMLFGFMPTIGAAALIVFLVPVTLMMHAYWRETDPAARSAESIEFYKNLALIGAALMTFGVPEPWILSL